MRLDEFGEATSSNVEAVMSLKGFPEIKEILWHSGAGSEGENTIFLGT